MEPLASQVFLSRGRPGITFRVDLQECIIEETSLGAAGKNPFSLQQWFPIKGLPLYQAAAGNALSLCFGRTNTFRTKTSGPRLTRRQIRHENILPAKTQQRTS